MMNNSIETYSIFANVYDLYVGKFNSDFDFYRSYCNKTNKIIEIGCGTGRILDFLLNIDCKVTGVDISQEMLDKAEKKLKKRIVSGDLKLINHDFSTDKLKDRFDIALLTFYTFNYILDNPADFLSNIYESLADKGLLLMDLFYPNSLLDRFINGTWIDKEFTVDGKQIKIRDNRKMTDDMEYRQQIFSINGKEIKINTKRKYYRPSDLEYYLKTAGFTTIEFSYDYNYNGFRSMIDETKLRNNYIVKAGK